jgi:2-(1,2-epoxy-1,2-dihydrophenyl)acetyl-CoA isomerase
VLSETSGPFDLGASLEQNYNPLVKDLRELPMPVIAAVNGVAAGAGCNLALACDIVIAARSANFIEAFSRIGLIPDAGGTYFLPRLVGPARAMALALLAEPVRAEQAVDYGLIWKCVDDDKLADETRELRAVLPPARLAPMLSSNKPCRRRALIRSSSSLRSRPSYKRRRGTVPIFRKG